MVTIRRRLGDRFAYLGGLPTAEVYAAAYKALGVPVYSSAVFNFIPKTAMAFYEAIAKDDHATVGRLIDEFFLPYLKIRNRRAGYAVSIVKAGAKLVGHDAGPVRRSSISPMKKRRARRADQEDGAAISGVRRRRTSSLAPRRQSTSRRHSPAATFARFPR